MSKLVIKYSLFINYFVFAILLNSVGTVILQVQNSFLVSETSASVLEAFKDISIAVTSFFVASILFRFGYKRSMLGALAITGSVCLFLPMLPHFWMIKLLFAVTGVSFAIIKSSTMATIGLVTDSPNQHASLMSFLESFFMVGVLCGYFLFGYHINDLNPSSLSWLHVYNSLAILSLIAILLLSTANLDELNSKEAKAESFLTDFVGVYKLATKPLIYVFLICAFLYVLIEQSIMTWLPTFNSTILNMSASLSIQMASILAASIAVGRFLGGIILRKVNWYILLSICIIFASVLVLIVLPVAGLNEGNQVKRLSDAPIAAFVFPLIGLVLAPIAPTINSVILSSLPIRQHTSMASLIVMFSALGGTFGSIVTGTLFQFFDGRIAFYFSLVPLTIVLFTLYIFKQQVKSNSLTIIPSNNT